MKKYVEENKIYYGYENEKDKGSKCYLYLSNCIYPRRSCDRHVNCGKSLTLNDLIVIFKYPYNKKYCAFKIEEGEATCLVGELSIKHLNNEEMCFFDNKICQIKQTWHYDVIQTKNKDIMEEHGSKKRKTFLSLSYELGGLCECIVVGIAKEGIY